MDYYMVISTPLGPMTAVERDGSLIHLDFGQLAPQGASLSQSPLLLSTAGQITEYFAGTRRTFDLPLAPLGTDFQKKVWSALATIPYGETRSYRDIAIQIGHPKAFRAVGGANHNNPISIITPCHRVIGASGSLTGYGGGLDKKEALLSIEQEERHA